MGGLAAIGELACCIEIPVAFHPQGGDYFSRLPKTSQHHACLVACATRIARGFCGKSWHAHFYLYRRNLLNGTGWYEIQTCPAFGSNSNASRGGLAVCAALFGEGLQHPQQS